MKKNKKIGFTLIESLIALSIAAAVSTAMIKYSINTVENQKIKQFSNNFNILLNGVDQRLAVDGYDFDKWTIHDWNNEEFDNLISKQLQATNSKCSPGVWNPINNENTLSLVPCDLYKKKNYGLDISAKITKDSHGFINKFVADYSFKTESLFKNNIKETIKSFKIAKTNSPLFSTGTSFFELIDSDTGSSISYSECLTKKQKCIFRIGLDRQGGNENLKVDGSNSMINSNISFLNSKGSAPLVCIKWTKDNNGNWINEGSKKCGIGFYKNSNTPVSIDIQAKNGTFENISLSKKCKVYSWNASTKIMEEDTYKLMPCGFTNDHDSIYQIADNIHSENGYLKNIYSTKANISFGDISSITSKQINTAAINANQLTIGKKNSNNGIASIWGNLNVLNGKIHTNGIIESYKNTTNITETKQLKGFKTGADLNDDINVISNMKAKDIKSNNISVTGLLKASNISTNVDFGGNGNIDAAGSISSNKRMYAGEYLQINGNANESQYCSPNGLLGRKPDGTLLSCVNAKWTAAMQSRKTYSSYSRTCVNFKKGATRLKNSNEYTCVLSNVRGNFRGWMEEADVSVSGDGYWYLYMNCGGTDVYSKAICWKN